MWPTKEEQISSISVDIPSPCLCADIIGNIVGHDKASGDGRRMCVQNGFLARVLNLCESESSGVAWRRDDCVAFLGQLNGTSHGVDDVCSSAVDNLGLGT